MVLEGQGLVTKDTVSFAVRFTGSASLPFFRFSPEPLEVGTMAQWQRSEMTSKGKLEE